MSTLRVNFDSLTWGWTKSILWVSMQLLIDIECWIFYLTFNNITLKMKFYFTMQPFLGWEKGNHESPVFILKTYVNLCLHAENMSNMTLQTYFNTGRNSSDVPLIFVRLVTFLRRMGCICYFCFISHSLSQWLWWEIKKS